jgi:hypothetical protein
MIYSAETENTFTQNTLSKLDNYNNKHLNWIRSILKILATRLIKKLHSRFDVGIKKKGRFVFFFFNSVPRGSCKRKIYLPNGF